MKLQNLNHEQLFKNVLNCQHFFLALKKVTQIVLLEEFIQNEKSEQHLLPHGSESLSMKKDQAR